MNDRTHDPFSDQPLSSATSTALTSLPETGWRGSPEVWLDAAYETLLESGVDAVKIQTLSKRLGLARTSFYRSFADRDAVLEALFARWREQNTGSLLARASAYADSLAEALLNICDCWFNDAVFDSRLEFAVRSWAMQSAPIRVRVHEADRQRIAAIAQAFVRFGEDAFAADVRARNFYLLQIGYISMQLEEPLALRMKRLPEYIRVFTGKAPKLKDMERFYARHHISSQDVAAA